MMEELAHIRQTYKPMEAGASLRRFFRKEQLAALDAITQQRYIYIIQSYEIMTLMGKVDLKCV